jgi:hypothetical protein
MSYEEERIHACPRVLERKVPAHRCKEKEMTKKKIQRYT